MRKKRIPNPPQVSNVSNLPHTSTSGMRRLHINAEIAPVDDLFLDHRLMTQDGGERRRGPDRDVYRGRCTLGDRVVECRNVRELILLLLGRQHDRLAAS